MSKIKEWFQSIVDSGLTPQMPANIDAAIYEQYAKYLEAENTALRERLEKTEHRAKGAERALKRFAENISCEDCPFFSDCSSLEKMKDFVHPNYCFAEYLRQAEKELQEKKDE